MVALQVLILAGAIVTGQSHEQAVFRLAWDVELAAATTLYQQVQLFATGLASLKPSRLVAAVVILPDKVIIALKPVTLIAWALVCPLAIKQILWKRAILPLTSSHTLAHLWVTEPRRTETYGVAHDATPYASVY